MTSEAPHRPGQEPGEVPPGAGGPTPYGDRSAQQDNGYPGAPDLGWAPPPPARQPGQSAPAWAAQDEQPPASTWPQQGGQPPTTATWGAAQVPQQAEPAGWATPGGSSQPTWAAQEQAGPAWAAASAPGPQAEQSPAWATPQEQPGPAWATEPARGSEEQSQPAWAQAGEPNARGAAQVPAGQPHDAWSTQDDPARSAGWAAASAQQQDDPARSGGWAVGAAAQQHDDPARSGGWAAGAAQQDDPARSGGWAVGAAAQQHDDPARSGGWTTPQQDSQPAWAQQGEQSAPAWAPAEAPVRGAAQVPAPTGQPNEAWSTQDDPARSGGWAAGTAGQQDDPARSGGWGTGAPAAQDDDPDRSGGWAAGRAAQAEQSQPAGWGAQAEQSQPSGWGAQAEQSQPAGWGAQAEQSQPAGWGAPENQAATAWSGAAAVPQQREDRPAPDWATPQEPAQAGTWDAAAVPAQGDDRPDGGAWTPDQPAAARASASVPSPDGPPAWGTNQDDPPKWTPERPVIPDAEPWSASEAWGRAAETESAAQQSNPQQSNGWEPARAEESPVYQPAPAPGISPANAVPLPPQEQRVPGASLAASPPADYGSAPFSPATEAPAQGEPAGPGPRAYESEQAGAVPGWGAAEPSHEQSQSAAAGPVIPAPRISPEFGAAGSVSASASVPMASRVTPPADQDLHPAGAPAPQPRVYGRPTRPEPDDAPEQEGPQGQPEQGPRLHDGVPQPRFDDHDRPSNANASAPPVPSAPPSSPAGPPPFPPGVPSFADPAANSRPVNGVHPHSGERPADPFGGPGGHGGPGDPYGPAAGPGGPGGQGDPFGGPAGGRATVNAGPGHGPGAMNEQAQGGFPPAFPPPPQQAPPAWQQQGMGGDPEQGRFDAFKPDAEPKTEAPTPKVRNGRVLAAVLIAAVLILAIPLGLLALLGKVGGDDKPAPFNPAVGSCIKQSGTTAAAANCAEPGAFTVVSRVESKDKCADPTQPTVELKGVEGNRVLCLKPAGK